MSKSVEVLIKNSDILRSQLLGATTKTQNLATHKNKIIRWGIIGIFIKELVAALIIASILFLMGALYFGLSKIYDPVLTATVLGSSIVLLLLCGFFIVWKFTQKKSE